MAPLRCRGMTNGTVAQRNSSKSSARSGDSWDDDAYIGDKEAGVLIDEHRIHPIDHEGVHFDVAGPLNVPRTPQGSPVLVQAGTSDPGRALAARHADVVYAAQPTLDAARAYYADIKGRAAAAGRDPAAVRVIPGVLPILGSTEAAARTRRDELAALVSDEYAREILADRLEIGLDTIDLDAPLPDALWDDLNRIRGSRGQFAALAQVARRDNLTVRQLAARQTTQWQGLTFVGTPEGLADTIAQWAAAGAADGFVVLSSVVPDDLRDVAEQVVPILRRRGLVRDGYGADTLRGHLGLTASTPRRTAEVAVTT